MFTERLFGELQKVILLLVKKKKYYFLSSYIAKTTLQKLIDLAGLHCTISERSGPSLLSMQLNFLSRPLSFLDWTTVMLF